MVSLYAVLSLLSFMGTGVVEVVVWVNSAKGEGRSIVALSTLAGMVRMLMEESLEAKGGSLMVFKGLAGLEGMSMVVLRGLTGGLGMVMEESREAEAENGKSMVVFSVLVGAVVMALEESWEAEGMLS